MHKLNDKDSQMALAMLALLTLLVAIAGITMEAVFLTHYLENVARQLSLLTAPTLLN